MYKYLSQYIIFCINARGRWTDDPLCLPNVNSVGEAGSNSSTVVKGLLLLPSSLSDNILYCLEIFQYNISEPLLHLNLYKFDI